MRVLIAADAPIVRSGLAALVAENPGMSVAGSGSTAPAELALQIEELDPDVVLLESDQRPLDARELTALLARLNSGAGPALVVLADAAAPLWSAESVRAGLRAVLPRDAEPQQIAAALKAAAAGLTAMPPEIMDAMLGPAAPNHDPGETAVQTLTPREVQVLRMMAEGLGNKEIAVKLAISEHTVKFHISSIFTKMDVASRTEAVTLGYRLGLIPL